GDDNHYATLCWVLRNVSGESVDVPEPVRPLPDGVYVPGIGGMPLSEGFKGLGSTGKPVIMIFFVSAYFTRGNTDAIDCLYRSVEEVGGEPWAVFYHTYPDELTGSIGIRRIIDEYLIKDGKARIDAALYTAGSSATVLSQPGRGEQVSLDNFFERFNVPVIQCINLFGSYKGWESSPFGLTPAEIAYAVVSPEYDGQIDGIPFSGSEKTAEGDFRQAPLEERCRSLAEMAYNWARLRHIPNNERKVAILIYMYPPRQDLAGGGYGLDTPQSVCDMLYYLSDEGYSLEWLPSDGKDLITRLLDGVTNDDNWKSDEQLRAAAVDLVSPKQYEEWFSLIPESARKKFIEAWGKAPGDIHVLDGKQLLPGIMNGNVFIGFQPDRGKCTTESIHDPWTSPPHQYLGFYRWLKYVWKTDAVVHIGTHGSLEWLPGKSVGLSEECYPDIILGKIPNINPYIIDNPGEGMQSKRRQYAVTPTHMIPTMARAGGYDELSELEGVVQAYLKTKEANDSSKTATVVEKILTLCKKLNLNSDLGLSSDCTADEIDEKVDELYDYLLEVKDTLIKDGLHILGEVPSDTRMCEMIYSLVRYPNEDIPSLRGAIAHLYGCDINDLLNDQSGVYSDGVLKGEIIDRIDEESFHLVETAYGFGFDLKKTQAYAHEQYSGDFTELDLVLGFICGFLIDAIRRMPDEQISVMRALRGEYISPGPAGCPCRNRAKILPTGRNFYSIDPDGIPWHSSWEIGSQMAESMVQRYLRDNGTYPNTVGIVLWATDTMKTGGDDVAYVLKLMGLRPVWDSYGGRVKDLKIIPLEELGRPRIDVTVRISGLFRDTFPNLSNLIDRGVQMISELDEDDDDNYLAANIRQDIVEALEAGLPIDKARREASYRIFGDPPGEYGCGISDAIATGNWQTVDDLAKLYVRHGSSVYGRGLQGESKPDMFLKRLSKMDVTVKNHNSRASDMLDMDDDFDCLGGMNAAVTSIRGKKPMSFMGDSSDVENLKTRTLEEECRFIFRSKVNNPKWLEGLKKHGFAGAKELSKLFDFTMGWSGTSDIIENWMYDDLADNFVVDKETREWIKDENPYAMMSMLARLYEAMKRGFWDPSDEMKKKLEDIYMEFEERIEEITDR
ncbi:MAG: cobaltochelatase subunit CobN, partial [archaeon]|nr:cobaltochelatase subunit CobN [archaeon]